MSPPEAGSYVTPAGCPVAISAVFGVVNAARFAEGIPGVCGPELGIVLICGQPVPSLSLRAATDLRAPPKAVCLQISAGVGARYPVPADFPSRCPAPPDRWSGDSRDHRSRCADLDNYSQKRQQDGYEGKSATGFVHDAVDQSDHRGGISLCGLGRAVADHDRSHRACASSCRLELTSGDLDSFRWSATACRISARVRRDGPSLAAQERPGCSSSHDERGCP